MKIQWRTGARPAHVKPARIAPTFRSGFKAYPCLAPRAKRRSPFVRIAWLYDRDGREHRVAVNVPGARRMTLGRLPLTA